jgi:hypothetical protein
MVSFYVASGAITRVDTEPRLAGNLKAIRDRFRRFFAAGTRVAFRARGAATTAWQRATLGARMGLPV